MNKEIEKNLYDEINNVKQGEQIFISLAIVVSFYSAKLPGTEKHIVKKWQILNIVKYDEF